MKIAIVKLSSLGDIVHSMSVLQLIKKRLPNSEIDWFVDKKFSLLLENNLHINRIYELEIKDNLSKLRFFDLFKCLKTLKSIRKYDVVIDMQGLLKSAIVSRLINSNKIVGFDRKSIKESFASFFYHKKHSIDYSSNIIKRNISLVSFALDIQIGFTELQNKEPFLFYRDISNPPLQKGDYIVIVPGASFKSKIYPTEKFIRVIRGINKKVVVIYNSIDEENSAKEIQSSSNQTYLLGYLDLNCLKLIIGNAKLVIGGDTGPIHMAWGMNVPSIALFSSTSAKRNFYETNQNKFVQNDVEINSSKIDKHSEEIKRIPTAKIVKIANVLLGENS